MNHTQKYDVAIIGAGTAGLNAWRAATGAGAHAVLIDPGPLGTTCARVGCMPSKLLIAASELAHSARRASEFGVLAETVHIDPVATLERVRRFRDFFVNKTLGGIQRIDDKGAIIHEKAHITGPHTIQAGDHEIVAGSIILATGSKPWVPAPYRDLGDRLLTNESIFELPRLPESLLVVGAGAIGLELGQAFHRLGTRVTIVELDDRIGAIEDPEVAQRARELFGEELDMHLHHQLEQVRPTDTGVEIRFIGDDGEPRQAEYQYVLAATGRRPVLEGLGLENACLEPLPAMNPETRQLGTSHFFVAGDASADRMLLHEAAYEGRIAGTNAASFPEVHSEARMTPLALVFSDPEIAVAGKRFPELDLESDLVESMDFESQSRAKVLGRAHGRMRVYADPTGRLLGATVMGPDAEHLGHQLAWLIQLGLTAQDALKLPFYHPVLEEGLQGVLRSIAEKAKG